MPTPRQNQRPPLVVAMEWVTQLTTISLEMSLPAAGGYWLDTKWGTSPWLVIVGAVLGFYVAMKHLMALTKTSSQTPGLKRFEQTTQRDKTTQQPKTNDRNE
ncbi:MAG: AtpZ/AtpI family protein [Planctomycetota bacterium]|nr:AtpZ/AtpI family protein [Planctomycetota bacterium]MDA1211978.1 AtpZ/AtpI family protein [Planctomycetota bacterium]